MQYRCYFKINKEVRINLLMARIYNISFPVYQVVTKRAKSKPKKMPAIFIDRHFDKGLRIKLVIARVLF